MNQLVTYGLLFLVLMGIVMFGPEFAGHAFYNVKANEVSEYAVGLAEREGGFTDNVISKVKSRMDHYNMPSDTWKIEYTQGKVDFNKELHFEISGKYQYRVFNLLNTGVGTKEVPVSSYRSGLSQVYFRA
ncbi:DUF4320 family protein [Bacillus cereus]|uniref:DUF4320 family protein n=1 Tax=Bacillus cereus group TaxID=86661 RepID=UPI0011C7BFE6|nr:DUF4320 family protein [Bacillus sp. AR18-7]TXR64556.1 DUF4320 family protein [Bacillus sp. AR18-7]